MSPRLIFTRPAAPAVAVFQNAEPLTQNRDPEGEFYYINYAPRSHDRVALASTWSLSNLRVKVYRDMVETKIRLATLESAARRVTLALGCPVRLWCGLLDAQANSEWYRNR